MSSTTSDGDDEPVDRKRQLSISPSNKGKTIRKFPRTAYRQPQLNGTQGAYQNDSDKNNSSRTHNTADTSTSAIRTRDHPKVDHESQPGTSQSALTSRKLREKVASGTYVIQRKRLENWKEKISNLDPGARFDRKNPQKVFHSRCSTWLLVKEPGDTTRFKRHVKTCQTKPTPASGTLMGMGWLKVGNVEMRGDRKVTATVSGRSEAKMPCRGVSDMDDLFVSRYLKQTGAGGGGGRSIHVISRERFEKQFRYLTRSQKEEVQEVQRAEWAWRNDHLNLRVHVTNCERFTSSHSIALSLCPKCERLLFLKVFVNATLKKTPLDENLKYTNAQYLNPVLGHLYGKVKGLRAIIEHPVSNIRSFHTHLVDNKS